MEKVASVFLKVLMISAILFAAAGISVGADFVWLPVSPGELAQKESKVEPDADAEAIFWDVRIDDSSLDKLVMNHYVRLKIFNERGRDRYSKFDIPFYKGKKVKEVAARVVRPDGSILEIKKEDVFDRVIIKDDDSKVKAKSFAIPNLDPGSILEYRYKEVFANGSANMPLIFQRDIPMQKISYYVKPFKEMQYRHFNMPDVKLVKEKNGFYVATHENVPSFKEEPRMPPIDEARSWMLLYYRPKLTNSTEVNSLVYWAFFNRKFSNWMDYVYKEAVKSKEAKETVEQITAGAATPQEKVQRIFDFCQGQIKNLNYDTSLTDEEKEQLSDIDKISDILKKKAASASSINSLFALLTSAAPLETRLVVGGDRSEHFFDKNSTQGFFVNVIGVAVRVNDEWQYFKPGHPYVKAGMLPWYEEGVNAMVINSEGYNWEKTPMTPPEKSLEKRRGKFSLSEDGTLEGDVTINYTGHMEIRRKLLNYDDSPEKREENLRNEIKEYQSAAEISSIRIENASETGKPFSVSYHVKIPNYALKTGKRLIMQPGFFEYGKKPLFIAEKRIHPVYFSFPWSNDDELEIALPKGFYLENADSPGKLADSQKVGSLDIRILFDKTEHKIKYYRKFHFGGGGNVLFPLASYPSLKKMFEAFNQADSHSLTLKQN